MFRILVVQPVLAHYRLQFFQELGARRDVLLRVLASAREPDTGITSMLPATRSFATTLTTTSCLFKQFYWQHDLSIVADKCLPDVIVFSGNLRYLSNIPLWWKARAANIAVVWWGHDFSKRGSSFWRRMRHAVMNHADSILVYTAQERSRLNDIPALRGRVFSANNAIATDEIEKQRRDWTPQQREIVRQQIDATTRKLFLFVGRLSAKCRLELALLALARLPEESRPKLVVIGAGELFAPLVERCVDLKLSNYVLWLGEIKEEKILSQYFLAADWFLYPGAIGLSLMHAFAYGLPVITHDRIDRQMPEFAALCPGQNGFTFQENDLDSLLSVIEYAQTVSEAQRATMSNSALEVIRDTHNLQRMADGFIDAVNFALAVKGKRRLVPSHNKD